MLKYLEEVVAAVTIVLCLACLLTWAVIIDNHVLSSRTIAANPPMSSK